MNKRHELRMIINRIKSEMGCMDCGETDPDMLTFHHLNTLLKDDNISGMISKESSMDDILEEIDKCIVLCFNCHMKLERDKEFIHRVDKGADYD